MRMGSGGFDAVSVVLYAWLKIVFTMENPRIPELGQATRAQ